MSLADLLARGLIHGGILDGPKARVLLALLLASDAPRETIETAFSSIGTPGTESAFRWPAP